MQGLGRVSLWSGYLYAWSRYFPFLHLLFLPLFPSTPAPPTFFVIQYPCSKLVNCHLSQLKLYFLAPFVYPPISGRDRQEGKVRREDYINALHIFFYFMLVIQSAKWRELFCPSSSMASRQNIIRCLVLLKAWWCQDDSRTCTVFFPIPKYKLRIEAIV